MLASVEPRTPLVEDIEELGETLPTYDAGSLYAMDVVEEHRYRSASLYSFPMVQRNVPSQETALPPRPRSPSIYSLFVTDHSLPKRPRCKNPSVYSMPIAAFGGKRFIHDSSSEEEEEDGFNSDDYDPCDDNDSRVFMTRGSRKAGASNRHTDVHTHGQFRARVKNPSVYSMPILEDNIRERAPTKSELQRFQVAPVPSAPARGEDSGGEEGKEIVANGEITQPEPQLRSAEETEPTRGLSREVSVKRAVSNRVKPNVQESITRGLNSCHGIQSRESLPCAYHVSVCMGIMGVLFFFIGMAVSIVGFTTGAESEGDKNNARIMKVIGLILLFGGMSMCIGCFIYLVTVYLRYKRLASYLKQREESTRRSPHPVQVVHRTASTRSAMRRMDYNRHGNGLHRSESTRSSVQRQNSLREAAAEDIRRIIKANHRQGRHTQPNEEANGDVAL